MNHCHLCETTFIKLFLITILFSHQNYSFLVQHSKLYYRHIHHFNSDVIKMSSTSSTANSEVPHLPEPFDMKIRDIKEELNTLNIAYNDCFDKESLCMRLLDARSGKVRASVAATSNEGGGEEAGSIKKETNDKSPDFDSEAKLQELRSLKVKELRTKCAEYNIRWAHMIEKDELVRALLQYYEKASSFSPTGTIVPFQVATITEDHILQNEIYNNGSTTKPLLLDVFATWCGPCKLMSPQLEEAAKELGESVRVAKIDSDLHPDWSNKLNVKGLPTIIVFDGMTGKELQRVEGALMKDDLVRLARSHV